MTAILFMNLIIACGLATHNSFSVASVYKLSLDEVVLLPMIREAAGWVTLTYDPPHYFLLPALGGAGVGVVSHLTLSGHCHVTSHFFMSSKSWYR